MLGGAPGMSGALSQGLRGTWNRLPERVKRPALAWRYGAPPQRQWLREAMNRELGALLDSLDAPSLDAVEVSGALHRDRPWRSYTQLEYPDFDLCDPPSALESFDLVICEQVLEHVRDPCTAAATLSALCRDGGRVLVSTPFLLRIHDHPGDYWRFTPDGLRILLEANGLSVAWVHSWGNRAAVRANLSRWKTYRRWRSLDNDERTPIVVWALAEKGPTAG